MGSPRQLEYFQIVQESAWGTDPETSYTGLAPDEYGVELENDAVQLDKYTGEVDDVFVDVTGQDLRGPMTLQVWPDIATLCCYIAGIPREADNTMRSYTIQTYDYAKDEYLKHEGLMANTVTITATGGDPKLKMQYELIGKAESTISQFAKPSLPSQASFELSDATFTIGGSAEANVEQFAITVNNNLRPSEVRDTSRNIKWLDAGRRRIEVTFTVRTDTTMANHYRNLVRTKNTSLAFVAAFNYPGTGSPIDTLTFTLSELVLRNVVRTGGVGDIQTLACSAYAKKPAGTAAIVVATG